MARDWNTYFTLEDYLFGGIELAKNTDPDKMYILVMVLDSIQLTSAINKAKDIDMKNRT